MSTVTLYPATGTTGKRLGSTSAEIAALGARGLVGRSSTTLVPLKRTSTYYGWLSALAFAVVAMVAIAQPWKQFQSAPIAAAGHAAELKTVKVDRPAHAAASSVVLPATIRPWQTTTLHARVSGYLAAWHADLGTRVKAGDLLAEIETPELDQELAEGKGLASEALAAATQARAERQEAEADLRVAEAQLMRVRAEADLAKSQLVRREKLLATHAISREEYDIFKKEVDARTADLASTEADVERRRTNLDTRTAIIAVREATARSRQSNVDRLQELQIFKRIVAPFSGVVTQRAAEVGMLVTAGKESLFTLEDTSRVRIQTNVPQAYSMQARRGALATISVPEAASQSVQASITRVADSVDSTSRTMLAEVELENTTGRFQPGSYARVALTVSQDASSWTIPTNTVQMRVEGPHVAIVNDLNRLEVKRVTLGRDLGSRVVVEGLRGDERLVVNPGDDLASGMQVAVGGQDHSPALARQ